MALLCGVLPLSFFRDKTFGPYLRSRLGLARAVGERAAHRSLVAQARYIKPEPPPRKTLYFSFSHSFILLEVKSSWSVKTWCPPTKAQSLQQRPSIDARPPRWPVSPSTLTPMWRSNRQGEADRGLPTFSSLCRAKLPLRNGFSLRSSSELLLGPPLRLGRMQRRQGRQQWCTILQFSCLRRLVLREREVD